MTNRSGTTDRGSAGLLLLAGGVLVVGSAAVAGALVAGATTHTKAQAAADAVALAVGAQLLRDPDACEVGGTVATRNGAELRHCDVGSGGVTVTVAVPLPAALTTITGRDRAMARARAELEYAGPQTPGP